MKVNQLMALLLTVGLTANAFAAKPPKIAVDLECSDPAGCVGTGDIENEAVTRQKLSADIDVLLSTIGELQAQIDQLTNPTMVIMDGSGATFGKVYNLENAYSANAFYQWQGFDLVLRINTSDISLNGRRIDDFYHTDSDCSDEPWVQAYFFDNNDLGYGVTILGEVVDYPPYSYDTSGVKIVGLADPSQSPVTITVAATSNLDGSRCEPQTNPYQKSGMVTGVVELTPGFKTDHPPPYTVVVE